MNWPAFAVILCVTIPLGAQEDFLKWDGKQARSIALGGRVTGQVGKSLDFRITATDRSYNFKLRATWLTLSTIRALARLDQIARALSDAETQKAVASALAASDIVFQVEIDPREGSGIIPSDWVALLGPRREAAEPRRAVRGISNPKLRDYPALAAVAPRDYSYEIFWLVFPSTAEDGKPLFASTDREAELAVRIHGKVGKVKLPIPEHFK